MDEREGTMNYDSFAAVGRSIARKNERVFGTHKGVQATAERTASLAARWLLYLAVGVAVAWLAAFAVPAFGGMLAATVVGFGVLWLVPWLVIAGVVRVLEAAE